MRVVFMFGFVFFVFFRTVLILIRIFLEYCQCVNDIPSIATDMLTRLSDLLKVRSSISAHGTLFQHDCIFFLDSTQSDMKSITQGLGVFLYYSIFLNVSLKAQVHTSIFCLCLTLTDFKDVSYTCGSTRMNKRQWSYILLNYMKNIVTTLQMLLFYSLQWKMQSALSSFENKTDILPNCCCHYC